MSIQENYQHFSPEYKLGRIDAVKELSNRLLKKAITSSCDDFNGFKLSLGEVSDYLDELLGNNK